MRHRYIQQAKKRISLNGISVICVCRNIVFADVTPEEGSKRVEVVNGVSKVITCVMFRW